MIINRNKLHKLKNSTKKNRDNFKSLIKNNIKYEHPYKSIN